MVDISETSYCPGAASYNEPEYVESECSFCFGRGIIKDDLWFKINEEVRESRAKAWENDRKAIIAQGRDDPGPYTGLGYPFLLVGATLKNKKTDSTAFLKAVSEQNNESAKGVFSHLTKIAFCNHNGTTHEEVVKTVWGFNNVEDGGIRTFVICDQCEGALSEETVYPDGMPEILKRG